MNYCQCGCGSCGVLTEEQTCETMGCCTCGCGHYSSCGVVCTQEECLNASCTCGCNNDPCTQDGDCVDGNCKPCECAYEGELGCDCTSQSGCDDNCQDCKFTIDPTGSVCDDYSGETDSKHTATDTAVIAPSNIPFVEQPAASIVTKYNYSYADNPTIVSCDFDGYFEMVISLPAPGGGTYSGGLEFEVSNATAENEQKIEDTRDYNYVFDAEFELKWTIYVVLPFLGKTTFDSGTIPDGKVIGINTPSHAIPGKCQCPKPYCDCAGFPE